MKPGAAASLSTSGVCEGRQLSFCMCAGNEFDDEDDSCYDKLHSIASQALDGSVDRPLLKRLVRAFVSLPFGGFV